MLDKLLEHKLVVSLITASFISVCGAVYGVIVAIPRLEEKIDNKVELLQQADASIREEAKSQLGAERDRSTVIDDYSTLWLSKTSERALDNSSKIKALETAAGIHHREHDHP
jgi:hypothetical protein